MIWSVLRRRGLALLAWCVCGVFLVSLVGCDSGPAGQRVWGEVTLDSAPLAEGKIAIYPVGPGKPCSAIIREGRYLIPAESGPRPGSYKVQITSFRGTGEFVEDPEDPTGQSELKRDLIPDQYNERTTLGMEVELDGANNFDFDLHSK